MHYKKYRWSKDYEAAEEELELLLSTSAKRSIRRDLTEHEVVEEVVPKKAILIWCAEGSLTVRLDDKKLSIQPGDTLHLSDLSIFSANAGIAGCVYYEALE